MEDNIIVKKEKNRLINFSLVSMLVMVFLLPLFFLPVGSFVQFGTSVMFAVVVIISFIFWSVSSLFKNEVTIPVGKFNILALFVSVPLFYTLSFVANGMSRTSFLGYTFDISTVGFIILSFLFLFLIPLIFNTKNRIFYGYVVSILSSIVFALFLIIRLIFGAAGRLTESARNRTRHLVEIRAEKPTLKSRVETLFDCAPSCEQASSWKSSANTREKSLRSTVFATCQHPELFSSSQTQEMPLPMDSWPSGATFRWTPS
jgi:hypothetical protein